jgi:tryptophan halogenase
MQIFTFCQEYLTEDASTTATESNINRYNKNTSEMYDYYKDFIVFHYQGGRDDSEFWRHIKEEKLTTPVVEEYIQRSKSRIPGTLHFNDYWGVDGLWKWTLAGLGFITPEQAKKELKMFNSYEYAKQYYNEFSQFQEYNLSSVERPFEIFPIYPQDSRG